MHMTNIPAQRLRHQQLIKTAFKTPREIVSFFGAMQSQEYASSKWGIGARLPGCQETQVEQAIQDKSIVRTTVFRGTLHLVAAEDIHWMLQLIAPNVKAKMSSQQRKLGLDEAGLAKTNQLITKALKNGNHHTRKELTDLLQKNGIDTSENRMNHIIYHASVERVICNGPLRGKQSTYTLLQEWVPNNTPLQREEALHKLAGRYFTSHGPATVHDFAQWAGISVADAKAGLQGVQSSLQSQEIDEITFWMAPAKKVTETDTYLLLPAFDEYFIGYKDRSTLIDSRFTSNVMTNNGIFNPIMVHNGQVIGTWKRALKKNSVTITTDLFKPAKKALLKAFEPAARQYADFLGLTLNGFS